MASIHWTNTIHLEKIESAARAAAKEALWMGGEVILAESDQHVPIEEGTLSRSGHVSEETGTALRVAVAYDTPYAVRQHEEMDYVHDAGRTAKYLENAFNAKLPLVRQLIADKVREALGGG